MCLQHLYVYGVYYNYFTAELQCRRPQKCSGNWQMNMIAWEQIARL